MSEKTAVEHQAARFIADVYKEDMESGKFNWLTEKQQKALKDKPDWIKEATAMLLGDIHLEHLKKKYKNPVKMSII